MAHLVKKHSGLHNNNKDDHCLNILNSENLIKERTFIFKIKLTLKYLLKTERLCSIFDNSELKKQLGSHENFMVAVAYSSSSST